MRPDVDAGQHEERSLGELFSDLTHESADLIRKEMELARVEITDAIEGLAAGVVSLLVGSAVILAGVMVLLLAAVRALDPFMPKPWLSPLIVGVVVMVIGAIAVFVGRSSVRNTDLTPDESVESLRKTKDMVQRHIAPDTH